MKNAEKGLEKATGLKTAARENTPKPEVIGTESDFMPEPFNPHPCIISYREPDSPAAEEYRKLKSLILMRTRDEFRNTLLVTSALSGEGKSITSANLAIMLARDYGQTVLLVDADLRRPSLPGYLGISPVLGLADCIEDNVDAGRAIVKTGVPKLSFLGPGKNPTNPGELLSSNKMKLFLNELKYRYRDRYIIVDASPILLFADAQAMSTMVDGVLVVIQEGTASRKSIQQMMDLLKGSNVLGIVYNNASEANLDGRYHHYYKYYHQKLAQEKQQHKQHKQTTVRG